MKETTVPIDQAGRIVLPKNVRQELAIKPGDTFKLTIHGSSVSLTPNRETTGFVRKGKAIVFTTSGEETLSDADVTSILEHSRDERDSPGLQIAQPRKRKT